MKHPSLNQIVRTLKKANRMTRGEIEAQAEQKFRKLVHHAAQHSAYYREAFSGLDLDTAPLASFPILTKENMMANFDDITTHPDLKLRALHRWLEDDSTIKKLYKDRWLVTHTSGSTGLPAVVVMEIGELLWFQGALSARMPVKFPSPWQIIKALFKPWRFATVGLITGRGSSGYAASFHLPKAPPFVKHQFFSMLDPVEKLVEDLNEYQPIGLFSLASVIDILAEEQLAGRLKLKLDTPVSGISVGGDTLHHTTREKVRAAWNLEIVNTYGATECGVVARSVCDYQHMHINSDLCYVEIVDAQNKPVPHGTRGAAILVTNFQSYSQPLIRYKLDDVASYVEEHDCGLPFPLLGDLDGRSDENFLLEADDGHNHLIRPYVFLVFDMPGIKRFQFLQVGRNAFELRYIAETNQNPEELQHKLRRTFEEVDIPIPATLKLKPVDHLELTRGGKFRMFLNQYHENPHRAFLETVAQP